jgi:hypothetical protein
MIQVNLDFADEKFREVLRDEIKNAVADIVRQSQLPHMMNKKELMKLLRIKDTKASELLNRPDFPVFREAGVLIPTHKLFEWIDKNTRWLDSNSKYFDKAI